jgi:hypothetical protein
LCDRTENTVEAAIYTKFANNEIAILENTTTPPTATQILKATSNFKTLASSPNTSVETLKAMKASLLVPANITPEVIKNVAQTYAALSREEGLRETGNTDAT